MLGAPFGRQDRLFYEFDLEEMVPADHLLRRIDAVLDLSWLRGEMKPHYSHLGCPSVCPELMVRMLVVGYCYSIRSERRLCQEVKVNMAYRWFCGLGLEDNADASPTITVQKLDDRVLAGLKDRMLAPDLFAEFAQEYQKEWRRLRRERGARRAKIEKEYADTEKRIERLVTAIEEGGDCKTLPGRIRTLEARREELDCEISSDEPETPDIVLHPNLPELYRRKVSDLRDALLTDPETRVEAITILRSLIDKIVLHPGDKRGELAVELRGQMASIVGFARDRGGKVEVMKWLVAEERYGPFHNFHPLVIYV